VAVTDGRRKQNDNDRCQTRKTASHEFRRGMCWSQLRELLFEKIGEPKNALLLVVLCGRHICQLP
ncbi:MAG: hypothetical protein CMJ69_15130, partial [Planctomycetaceae bacterium]|nr:hypothetical protein [Planctomycetaceae bacterium]